MTTPMELQDLRAPKKTGGSASSINSQTTQIDFEPEDATFDLDASKGKVDVEKAQAQFTRLSKQLSRLSHRTEKDDIEKQGEGDDFDLVEYLRNASSVRDDHGFHRKQLGVVFENLGVTGAGGIRLNIRTFPDAFKEPVLGLKATLWGPFASLLSKLRKDQTEGPAPKQILHSFNGFLKPGENCLVLGRPGSGCSTFLKVIANQRVGFTSVDGEVEYGGMNAEPFDKLYRGEVVYNQEDDIHHATLTVAQTLKFALGTKVPAKRLPGVSEKAFQEELLTLLLKMLNIEHTRDTLVGGANVRGVSGGERKRVSIAEMMAGRACVFSWDNSTRGLDASTALDYAKSLRIVSNIFNSTMFVSLYQAGEGIYEQFDKVMVIDDGRQIYFGPASEARPYMISLGFKDLPRQTTADYLTGCTDENERQLADGIDPATIPQNSEALEKAWLSSEICKRMDRERREYKEEARRDRESWEKFEAAVMDDKTKFVGAKSPFTVPFHTQVWKIAVRQAQLRMQDRVSFLVGWFTSITIAIICGTCYLNLPLTAAGAFTRGGVLFTALLFNAFNAFNELPTQMLGRPIVWKQNAFCFYRPSAFPIGSMIADLPFQLIQLTVFCVIIYFMTGLVKDAGAFFTFVVIICAGFMSLASFFRLLGSVCFSFDIAARAAGVIMTLMLLYSGYLVPVYSMRRFLFWLYYINPVNYGFAALMGNEFGRISLECVGSYIVPNGPGYPATLGENQVCTLLGAEPGNPSVSGSAYISAGYEYSADNVWRNFGILLAFWAFFVFLQVIAAENLALGQGAPAINVFAPEDKERKELNDRLQSRKKDFRSGKTQQNLGDLIQSKKPFTWENLTYDVPVAGGQKRLLDDVFGYVMPGTLTALMGASGAGKTTLLDVLAGRKNIGVVGGDVLVAGRAPGRDFQRGTAYCEQQDVHEFTQTVREALRVSAYLRQAPSISIEEKNNYVEEVIQLLEMEDIADAMIGFPGFGLGVEARKRVTIGVELAAKPQLLLFLDEPTSGLDGQSAFNIVRFLRKLASAGQAILCTIHQPNALLFENFDRLLLLKRGGRCIYFGDIGHDSHVIRNYFAARGAHCPSESNPAEYMLEAIGAGSQRRVGDKDWADLWLESEEHAENKRTITHLKEESARLSIDETHPAIETEFATPFMTQLRVIVKRQNLALWRNPDYQFTKFFNHISISLLTGLTYLQADATASGLQYRVFVIFIASVLPAIIISQIEPSFINARNTFIRESSSKMYSRQVFFLAQFVGELPYSVLCATAYFLLYYYVAGFQTSSDRAGYAFLMILVTELYSVLLGQAVASLSPSIFVAALINPFLLVMFSLFCGVTVPGPLLPKFWREWMYPLDPFTRLIGGLVVNEMQGLKITCKQAEFSIFQPPSGQTCLQWAGDFAARSGGYLNNPNATSSCEYCPYEYAQSFSEALSFKFENRWRDLGIMVAFTAFNLIVGILGTQFLTFRYAKR